MRYYTFLHKKKTAHNTHHYSGDLSNQEELPYPDFLIIEEKPDGVFLNRYTINGENSGDTWHSNVEEAKEQSVFEYEDNIDGWKEIPEDTGNELDYVLEQLKKN